MGDAEASAQSANRLIDVRIGSDLGHDVGRLYSLVDGSVVLALTFCNLADTGIAILAVIEHLLRKIRGAVLIP